MKKIAIYSLLLILVVHFYFLISKNIKLYTTPFNSYDYDKVYNQSQYVVPGSAHIIPDEIVFAHAGWRYVNGDNPILINGEAAPFGKYLIGIGEVYFHNERVISLIFNILCLGALFFLANLVLKSIFTSLLLTVVFSFEKIFVAQMIYAPSLDNIQLFLILTSFIFYVLFLQSIKKSGYLIAAFLSLGTLMSVKFWLPGVLIFIIWFIHTLFLQDKRRFKLLLLYSPVVLISMLIIFIPVFLHGESLQRFFGYQKYLYQFYKSKLDFNFFGLWQLLIFNRWQISSNSLVQAASDWQITWPIFTLISLAFFVSVAKLKKIKKTLSEPIGVIIIWIIVYSGFLSTGTILPRYIFPMFPAFYILSFYYLRVLLAKKW